MSYEPPSDTWKKRFFSTHYGYRDFHRPTPVAQTEAAAMLLTLAQFNVAPYWGNSYYRFGLNARAFAGAPAPNPFPAVTGIPGYFNWPYGAPMLGLFGLGLAGDPFGPDAVTTGYNYCFAREIMVYSENEAYVRFLSLNPEYLRQLVLFRRAAIPITAAPFLWENERRVPPQQIRRYFPSYGLGISFRTPVGVVPTALDIDVAGNVEGTE